MQGSTSKETHFRLGYIKSAAWKLRSNYRRVNITSDSFAGMSQPARHRSIYTLLKDELAAEGGIHALQLKTKTPEEIERAAAKEMA
jgi:BolA-like protein 1